MPKYKTPAEHRLLLHFSKSRFNRRFEDTLLRLAEKLSELPPLPVAEFKKEMTTFLSAQLGQHLSDKAIANNITEPTRLFGLVVYQENNVFVGDRTINLAKDQDVPSFFKSLCYRFQFPNGINKIQVIEELVAAGVRFKPAQYIIKLLRAGGEKTGRTFAVTAQEVAQLVFNDKRVTVDQEDPGVRVEEFIRLRDKGILCETDNKVIRYTRDFLNFMVWANLLREYKKQYFLNDKEKTALDFIADDDTFFEEFDIAKQGDTIERQEIKEAIPSWMEYYADSEFAADRALKTSLASFSQATVEITGEGNKVETVTTKGIEFTEDILEAVAEQKADRRNLKAIGDEGEAIMYSIEKNRVQSERPDLLPLVRIVSNDTSLGFDIQSILDFDTATKKFIEVKTTKRNFTPTDFGATAFFNISANEWNTAKQYGDNYFIARVIIAKEKLSIFIIQNPCKRLEEEKLKIFPVDYRLIYQEESGSFLIKDKINI